MSTEDRQRLVWNPTVGRLVTEVLPPLKAGAPCDCSGCLAGLGITPESRSAELDRDFARQQRIGRREEREHLRQIGEAQAAVMVAA